jgi:hypothetical protein
MAGHRPGHCLARIHPNPSRRKMFVPRRSLPYPGPLFWQQMSAKICLPADAFLRSLRSPKGNLHWHLQAAISLFLPHSKKTLGKQWRLEDEITSNLHSMKHVQLIFTHICAVAINFIHCNWSWTKFCKTINYSKTNLLWLPACLYICLTLFQLGIW